MSRRAQPDRAGNGTPAATDLVPSFVGLFKRLSPSVVNIYTQEVVTRALPSPWGLVSPDQNVGTSLGSGMVLDLEGHILTNAHVVENAAEIRVRFSDESELPARLVGLDPVRDLAVLKVDGAIDLLPVVPGDSGRLEVGDWVIAIGNPFGLAHTITKGIVSGKGRSELVNDRFGYLDLIQTDAAINQGSSGGPLFDMQGRVVAVNTAVNAEGHGIGFAIGWDAVEEALPRLMQGWPGLTQLARGVRAPGQPRRGDTACARRRHRRHEPRSARRVVAGRCVGRARRAARAHRRRVPAARRERGRGSRHEDRARAPRGPGAGRGAPRRGSRHSLNSEAC